MLPREAYTTPESAESTNDFKFGGKALAGLTVSAPQDTKFGGKGWGLLLAQSVLKTATEVLRYERRAEKGGIW